MDKKLYALYAVVFSLTMLACSNDSISGSSEDPNAVTAENDSSSSSLDGETSSSAIQPEISSSSSAKKFSSSSKYVPVLCKASVDWGYDGCLIKPPSGNGDLWSYGLKVKTDAYADDPSKFGERAGEFFVETDSIEGGETKLYWFGSDRKPSNFESCSLEGYIHANVVWNKGNLPYELGHDPYFNLGFYVAGFDSDGVAMSADISNWNGMCFVYSGTTKPTLQLDLGDSINKKLGNALPSVTLFNKQEPQCFEWKDFKQPAMEKKYEVISGEEAAKHVEKVIFHFQALPRESFGDAGDILILAIGTNRIDPNQSSSSSVQSSSSSESDPCKERGGKDCVASGHADLWTPGNYYVNTRLYTDGTSKYGNDRSGYFFFEDGSEKGGDTWFEFYGTDDVITGSTKDGRPRYYVIDNLSAGLDLMKGSMDSDPFFDIGFYVAGFDTNGEMLSANIQNWNGICVVANYEGSEDIKLTMQLDPGDSISSSTGNALPEVALESSESTQCFEWNQFKQSTTDKESEIISGEEAAKHAARIIFHFQASSDESLVVFNISAIGSNREE